MSYWKRVQKTINTGRKDQASMVFGQYIKVRKQIRMAKDGGEVFEKACEIAGVQKTVRQRNKFNRGVGAAYQAHIIMKSDQIMRDVTKEIFGEVVA